MENLSFILFGILPLIIFVVIDSIAGLKTGILAAVIFALAEAGYTLWAYGTVDGLTIGSLVLVLIFGFISYKANNAIYIKLQPVFLGVIFGAILIVMQLMGKPLLVLMIEKYQYMLPDNMRVRLLNPAALVMMARLSGVLGVGCLLHAGAVAYAAFYMNNWWWLLIRGIGLYVMMALCVVWVRLT